MTNNLSQFVNHPVTVILYESGYVKDFCSKRGCGDMRVLLEFVDMCEYIGRVKMRNNVEYTEKFVIDCADRYLAGKRRTTMPYHSANKKKEKERNKNMKEQGGRILVYVEDAIKNNEKVVASYLSGNTKAIGALVGYVLKKDKVDPAVVNALLKEKLDSLQRVNV